MYISSHIQCITHHYVTWNVLWIISAILYCAWLSLNLECQQIYEYWNIRSMSWYSNIKLRLKNSVILFFEHGQYRIIAKIPLLYLLYTYCLYKDLSWVSKCKTNTIPILIFDAPDAHFDYSSLFSGTQAEAEKVGNPKKRENCTRAGKKPHILCREIEPNRSKNRAMHEGDNPSIYYIYYILLHYHTTFLFISNVIVSSTALSVFTFFPPDFHLFRPEHHRRDVSSRNAHLVHQNC
jgi:hypothetical protein